MKHAAAVTGLLACLALCAPAASGASILLCDSGGQLGYGFGYARWANMTAALDAASGNGVTVVADFLDLPQMMRYDAIWLDQRWTEGVLDSREAANIAAFAATGRRAVLMGENASWASWNSQILGIVGGTFDTQYTGSTGSLEDAGLTSGAGPVWLQFGGLANGGTALFDRNWATVWGERSNVLTLLDVNVLDDRYWGMGRNGAFAQNVARWICGAPGPVVPEPGSLALLAAGLGGMLLGLGRRRG